MAAESPAPAPHDQPATRGPAASVNDVIDVVTTYAKQETVEPLKRAGRYVGFGAAGGLLTGIGSSLLLLGLLRFVQSEWSRSARGGLSWLPYLITLVAAIALGGAGMWFANRQIRKSILGEESR